MLQTHPKNPRLLLTDRGLMRHLERARLRVDGGRVVAVIADDGVEKGLNIPYANIAILMLGQGCSITSEAARLLAEEGVHVCFTGTGGAPLHYGALTSYQTTERMRAMFRISDNADASLEAARLIMRARIGAIRTLMPKVAADLGSIIDASAIEIACQRFEASLSGATDGQNLMGHEGGFAKELYAAASRDAGYRRTPGAQRPRPVGRGPARKSSPHIKPTSTGPHDAKQTAETPLETSVDVARRERANSRIDHGNYLAYGVAGAALWTLGIPAGLSVLHGKTRPGGLVFDIADSFKDAIILPSAFASFGDESEHRAAAMGALQDHRCLHRCFALIDEIAALDPVAR